VFYHNPTVPSGGVLDLDSNAECEIDHKNNENITWSNAPEGTYTVRLDYWDSCGTAKTNYVVTVHEPGKPVKVFNGFLTGSGDQGATGSGMLVTRFSVGGAPATSGVIAHRTWVQLPGPDSPDRAVRLTNEVTTPGGIGHPKNTGQCPIFLYGVDAKGRRLPTPWLQLDPNQDAPWYRAAPDAVAIVVTALAACGKPAEVEFDTPNG
jgi:hypothetical protein